MPQFRAVEGGPCMSGSWAGEREDRRLRMGHSPDTTTVPNPTERQTMCASQPWTCRVKSHKTGLLGANLGTQEAGLWFPMDLIDPSIVSAMNSLLTQHTVKGIEDLGHAPKRP